MVGRNFCQSNSHWGSVKHFWKFEDKKSRFPDNQIWAKMQFWSHVHTTKVSEGHMESICRQKHPFRTLASNSIYFPVTVTSQCKTDRILLRNTWFTSCHDKLLQTDKKAMLFLRTLTCQDLQRSKDLNFFMEYCVLWTFLWNRHAKVMNLQHWYRVSRSLVFYIIFLKFYITYLLLLEAMLKNIITFWSHVFGLSFVNRVVVKDWFVKSCSDCSVYYEPFFDNSLVDCRHVFWLFVL